MTKAFSALPSRLLPARFLPCVLAVLLSQLIGARAGASEVIHVRLGNEAIDDAKWTLLQEGVKQAGADLEWSSGTTTLASQSERSAVAFLQSFTGERKSSLATLDANPPTTRVAIGGTPWAMDGWDTELGVGDMVLLRPGERLRSERPADWLVFHRDPAWPTELPSFIRPDFDPQITDTPGGCATEAGAYRRVCLTWQGKNGPYLDRLINSHRIRVRDSFSHYHPIEGGFDELYLVQDALPGAELIVSEKLDQLLNPKDLNADDARQLLHRIPLQTGDLVFLPRGTMHRGLGGVLAHVITLPGFIPGAEIPVDDAIRGLNDTFDLDLPVHGDGLPFVAALTREDRVRIEINDQLFTEYLFDRARPCFFPVLGESKLPFTRGYPIEPRANEAEDHPHHTSLWFAHGDVDGHDFWHDPKTKMRLLDITDVYSRPGEAGFTAHHEWLDPEGNRVLLDRRVFRIHANRYDRMIDWDLTLTAPDGHTTHFGDTKEGTMAIRTRASMRVKGPVAAGHLVNEHGVENGAAWGKRSRWLLNTGLTSGLLGGESSSASITILQHPQSFRYPTWWHAREYGLIGANPFGVHAFTKSGKGSGDKELQSGESIRLRYRFLFAERKLSEEYVEAQAEGFAKETP